VVTYCDIHNRIKQPDGTYIWLQQVVKLGPGVKLQDLGVQVMFTQCDYCKEEQGRLFDDEA
jgi:hypothetical protein